MLALIQSYVHGGGVWFYPTLLFTAYHFPSTAGYTCDVQFCMIIHTFETLPHVLLIFKLLVAVRTAIDMRTTWPVCIHN